ncbi:MAG TPA: 1-acyl-sn-glycerol-3-phosphate acyltransferase [Candidatus Enterocloster excrementigallinarum]|uniref:1-acyl-sn-glycerol-3-phosphate acyltransferase n=1 Tax=Candidatus Enterocloster excrementigallinarum TaxID=2838558 RepID=A0A9D2TEA3_9FIRM|nr:1-acyl-sn-glycerol-3-phosphate acyltransferase [Candidatus Enterocloster excrementigallinarum]
MKRIIYMVFMNLFWAPIWLFTIHRMGRQEDSHTRQERYDYIARMVKRIIRYGRVNLVIKGQENIPDHDGFIIFPNHQGLFDMLALFASCPRPLSVVIKKEAANWILVKDVLAATRSLSMDREDIKSQVKVISEVGKRVKAGENFVIFAEGHRSRKGNEILEFKSGTFKSATKASCTIVPVALINSFRPFDINSLKRETVEVHYLKPIDLEEYFSMNTAQIAQMVQNRIEEEIKNTLA